MKKFFALCLSLALVLSLAACGGGSSSGGGSTQTTTPAQTTTTPAASGTETPTEPAASTLKVGVVLVGDENEGYTYAHIEGIRKAMEACGLTDDNMVWFYSIPESEECYDKCIECGACAETCPVGAPSQE